MGLGKEGAGANIPQPLDDHTFSLEIVREVEGERRNLRVGKLNSCLEEGYIEREEMERRMKEEEL